LLEFSIGENEWMWPLGKEDESEGEGRKEPENESAEDEKGKGGFGGTPEACGREKQGDRRGGEASFEAKRQKCIGKAV